MSAEKELQKLKKNLAKSRAEIALLQKKLQCSLLRKNGAKPLKPETPQS
jgi:hypothetical protein